MYIVIVIDNIIKCVDVIIYLLNLINPKMCIGTTNGANIIDGNTFASTSNIVK